MIYAAMLSFRGKNGRAFPSIRRLSAMVGLACGTVSTALKILIATGLLHKARRWAGKHNLYLVALFEKRAKRKGAPACTTQNAQIIPLSNATFDTFIVASAMTGVKCRTRICLGFYLQRVYQNLYNKPLPTLLTKQRKELSIPIAESIPTECAPQKRTAQAIPSLSFFFVPSKNAVERRCTKQKKKGGHASAIRWVLNEPQSCYCPSFTVQVQTIVRRPALLSLCKPQFTGRTSSFSRNGWHLNQVNVRFQCRLLHIKGGYSGLRFAQVRPSVVPLSRPPPGLTRNCFFAQVRPSVVPAFHTAH